MWDADLRQLSQSRVRVFISPRLGVISRLAVYRQSYRIGANRLVVQGQSPLFLFVYLFIYFAIETLQS
jgi:hypothetical protein